MYNIPVKISSDRTWKQLIPVRIGTGSDALFNVQGVPNCGKGWQVRVYVTRIGHLLPVYFDSEAGSTTVFVPGANFAMAGYGGSYEVAITELATDRRYWMGRGTLDVVPATHGDVTPGDGTGLNTYIRNPATGLWHKVTASVNEDGDITTEVAQEGVVL